MNIICLDLNNTLVCTKRIDKSMAFFRSYNEIKDGADLFKQDIRGFLDRDKNAVSKFMIECHNNGCRMFYNKDHDNVYITKFRPGADYFIRQCRKIADVLIIISDDDKHSISSTLNCHNIIGYFDWIIDKSMMSGETIKVIGDIRFIPKHNDNIILVDDKPREEILNKINMIGNSRVDTIKSLKYDGVFWDCELTNTFRDIEDRINSRIKTAA